MAVVSKYMHLTSVQKEKRGLPKPILYYLKKNANPKLLLKLMQTSKYFCFEEFPFMVISELKYENDEWEFCTLGSDKYEILDINNVPKKLWITQCLQIPATNSNVASSIFSKIIVGDNTELILGNQKITFNEFKFLTKTSKLVCLAFTSVVEENGDIVPIEMLIQTLPPLQIFYYHLSHAESFTSESTKNIIKALINSKIAAFVLSEIPDTFDFDAFSNFMKKSPHSYFLRFRDDISYEFRQKLQTFQNINAMNSADGSRCKLRFPGQTFPTATDDNKYLLKSLLCFLISSVLYLFLCLLS